MTLPERNGADPPQPQPRQQQQLPCDPPAAIEDTDDRMVIEGPNDRTLHLWREVAQAIDENQSVVWKNAVDSLEDGLHHLHHSNDARRFVERYMKKVIGILLEQLPHKIGMMERNCVETSLKLSLSIIEEDLKLKAGAETDNSNIINDSSDVDDGCNNSSNLEECVVLDVLGMIFDKKKQFYKGSKLGWNNALNGLPQVRNDLVLKFRSHRNFGTLARYLRARAGHAQFPSLETIRLILVATGDAVLPKKSKEYQDKGQRTKIENDLIDVCKAVMKHLNDVSEDYLKKNSNYILNIVRDELQSVFDPLFDSRREETFQYYEFCRNFALKLISSQSLPLKLHGWDTVADLIEAAQNDYSPPPKCYIVSGAGTHFVNGVYKYAGKLSQDGFVAPRGDMKYECDVPPSATVNTKNEAEGKVKEKAKKITLFRCTMRSQQKWWFLSEADEHQPGTDKDIDYYQHKSKKEEEDEPPTNGWTTCRDGADPPPALEAKGIMVPPGEEYNTMEHQLAKWAINNNVVELVLGSSIHREIVARSIPLIKFLASMCTKDNEYVEAVQVNDVGPNAYCLQVSHLTLAWNTCKSKLDPAVSAEVYHLLAQILPSLPTQLAVELITIVQQSLGSGNDSSHLNEVADFCSTLAGGNPDSVVESGYMYFHEDVRVVILNLFWAILTHSEAHTLKCYKSIKSYVMQELRTEPMGTIQRKAFLQQCKKSLISNCTDTQTDETEALRVVSLTQFVLESCPQEQSTNVIFVNDGELAKLVFNELVAYLNRRSNTLLPARKTSSNLKSFPLEFNHSTALIERLNIIRYVYGISATVDMDKTQLDTIWRICNAPEDREAIMVFLANASTNQPLHVPSMSNDDDANQASQVLTSAYSKEIQLHAFRKLFCSDELDWKVLGIHAFRSFQRLFITLKMVVHSFLELQKPALDTLWRISLQAGNDIVASQAMRDLLQLYSSLSEAKQKIEQSEQNAWVKKPVDDIPFESIETFADKIFASLDQVRAGLRNKDTLSVRSAERCVQILNAAIASTVKSEKKAPQSTIHFNPSSVKGLVNNVADVVKMFPHGLRGQACNRTISILARRASSGQRPQSERFLLQVHPLESLRSITVKVSRHCKHDPALVRPINFNSGRSNLNIEPDYSIVDSLGIVEGSEVVFLLCNKNMPQNQSRNQKRDDEKCLYLSMSDVFGGSGQGPSDNFFQLLIDVLEALTPSQESNSNEQNNTSKLLWDLLQSVPSNEGIIENVRKTSQCALCLEEGQDETTMAVDIQSNDLEWSKLLDPNHYQKAVYVMQIIDSFLCPSTELLEQVDKDKTLAASIVNDSRKFRQAFIESGGFDAIVSFFNRTQRLNETHSYVERRETAHVLRIIKCCLFGRGNTGSLETNTSLRSQTSDDIGTTLLSSLHSSESFYTNLAGAVVSDDGVDGNSISDSLVLLQALFRSHQESASVFASIPYDLAERFMILLLMWESKASVNVVSLGLGRQIRKTTEEIILLSPIFSAHSLPWLIKALETKIDSNADASEEYFSVLIRLVEMNQNVEGDKSIISGKDLTVLSSVLCGKLTKCTRSDGAAIDYSTVLLCGCLKLIQVLINVNATASLSDGVDTLMKSLNTSPWSLNVSLSSKDRILVDLMGVIFDAFLSDGKSASDLAICFESRSRRLGFDIIFTCANACNEGIGYVVLSSKIQGIISSSSPFLRHRWGQNIACDDNGTMNAVTIKSQYSGLRNQGCTCYMNSVLQQLFMMPEFRENLCSATLPSELRSSGGTFSLKGSKLIGKHVMMYWESGSSYEAIVESYDEQTTMHKIRYLFPKDSNSPDGVQSNFAILPEDLSDEFILAEGRPGKETGVYEIIQKNKSDKEAYDMIQNATDLKETEDEISFRRLLEEVQRTFVHLDKGSRGRAFDPRSLVEASGCLKLEFDIWQQNDASEFAMKLLDKLEIPLKRWSPDHFRYLENTFRLKQTKQKVCKECGLVTNREENLMNIDCQIRGKSDIHEALATMCEVEYMEGDNRVYCERCKRNTDTVLRTAISALPDMLILSLKRFDLDYNTFETVKLNSRCAFDQNLSMKKYTLEGVEAMEKISNLSDDENNISDDMFVDPFNELPDEDYEYKLAGVLVHHGVAQGGHYYSFIRDRTVGSHTKVDMDKWYRFDDDEVSPFDASQIEVECFGGKVKKETKWPNGQVSTVETDQLANALMLFYEKVKPSSNSSSENSEEKDTEMKVAEDREHSHVMTTGFEVFDSDVKRSNSVHRSHAFLFDNEFQRFVRSMVNVALPQNKNHARDTLLNASPQSEVSSEDLNTTWRAPILELSISYFFDILLHSVDNSALDDWTQVLKAAMTYSHEGAKWFIHELAKRTESVNDNWLRIYGSDCPEKASRESAMEVISTAINRLAIQKEEISALKSWTQAWIQQLNIASNADEQEPLPTSLKGAMRNLEDINKIENSVASSIGIIISFLCTLLELAPRTWYYNAQLCYLLTEMTYQSTQEGTETMREALQAAQIPARLIALLLRDKAPLRLQLAFPGASLSYELSESLSRPITSPTAHIFPLGANVGPSPGVVPNNSVGSPSPSDNVNTLEALASIIGIEGAKNAQLVVEMPEGKGRTATHLTDKAKQALTIVFNECASRDGLMDQKDIFSYMKMCGFDAMTANQQRINNIIAKYGTDSKFLAIDGFLNYYRDTSQSNSIQIRSDLHTFGFRPDLTRCSVDSRIFTSGDRNLRYSTFETIANDVFSMMNPNNSIGALAECGLASLQLYHNVYFVDSNLTEYLLSWYGLHQQDLKRMINDTLRSLYQAQAWGNETVQICVMTLMVFAALPGESQSQCINHIMQSGERLDARGNVGSGLLIVAKELSLSHSAQQYSADYSNHRTMLDRYIDAFKEMQKVRSVGKWMTENRSQWEWLDQVVQSQATSHGRGDYRRGEYQSRRDRDGIQHVSGGGLYDHNNSDSDPNGEMNYSDESDDYGHEYRPGVIIVKGAGMSEINGIYTSSRKFDGVSKFTKTAQWQNQQREFTLFRCVLSDHSRRWYISIIPPNQKPGTNKDIDFYYCPATGVDNEIPHEGAWEPNSKDPALSPAPTVEWKCDDLEDTQRVSSNDEYDNIVDDSNYDDEMDEPQN